MDIVPLLDDELLDGYRGRLAVLNNAESKAAIHQLFRVCFPVTAASDGQSTFVPSVALALGISLGDLLGKHTMWPLFAAFPDRSTEIDQEEFRYSPVNSSVWLKAARNSLWMCPQCIVATSTMHSERPRPKLLFILAQISSASGALLLPRACDSPSLLRGPEFPDRFT